MKVSHVSGEIPRVPRILAVDDRRANLICLQLLLEPEGYEVVIETSGRQAIAVCETTRFDLVLLDVMMPEIDGIQVARCLRAEPTTWRVPILFVTAAPEMVKALSFPGPPIEVIAKPIDVDDLRARAARLLRAPTPQVKAG